MDTAEWYSSQDGHYLLQASKATTSITCNRGAGCVVVLERKVLCTGFTRAPIGMPSCDKAGHLWRRSVDEDGVTRVHCVRSIHAEQDAIARAARQGIALDGAAIYCTIVPCPTCAKLLIEAGLARVVASHEYRAGGRSHELFTAAGVTLNVVDCAQDLF